VVCGEILSWLKGRICPEAKDSDGPQVQLLKAQNLWSLLFESSPNRPTLYDHSLYKHALSVADELGFRIAARTITLREWKHLFPLGEPSQEVLSLLRYRRGPHYDLTQDHLKRLSHDVTGIGLTLNALRYFLSSHCSKASDYKEYLSNLESVENNLPNHELAVIDADTNPIVIWETFAPIVPLALRFYPSRTSILVANVFRAALPLEDPDIRTVDYIIRTCMHDVLHHLLQAAKKLFAREAYRTLTIGYINKLWQNISNPSDTTMANELRYLRALFSNERFGSMDPTVYKLLKQYLTEPADTKFIGELLNLLGAFNIPQTGDLFQ
jgi:hypothetical protein